MGYSTRGADVKCSRCLDGMQVYEDIHKNGVWTCPTCGYTNTVNFDKVETYIYPDSPMQIGITYHFIPYDEEHAASVKKYDKEKWDAVDEMMHALDVTDNGFIDWDEVARKENFDAAAEDAENKNK